MPDPLLTAAREVLERSHAEMRTCIEGLPPEALNWRPAGPDSNSLAVLATHVLGSTRWWLAVALGAPPPERDGGSEFMAQFENACRQRGVKLFVLPPRSPKLNGHVERAQRTHKEEFYYRLTSVTTLTQISRLLRRWEDVHNRYRPHQALGQITPLAFYQKCA